MDVYKKLQKALSREVRKHHLFGKNISVRCKALSSREAIGRPDHDDYPIVKGREVIVEAIFQGAKGQAFADEFENAEYLVDDLLKIRLDSNRRRASFISGLNAVFRYLDLCDKTVHCKDQEPKECARHLSEVIGAGKNVFLVGYQPRFLEALALYTHLRVTDMDQDHIGSDITGIVIEPPEAASNIIQWCDVIFATGSTIVNGTLPYFLNQDKPVIFYGVTISAAAGILNLQKFCHCGQ